MRRETLGIVEERHLDIDVPLVGTETPSQPDLQQHTDETHTRYDLVPRTERREELQQVGVEPHGVTSSRRPADGQATRRGPRLPSQRRADGCEIARGETKPARRPSATAASTRGGRAAALPLGGRLAPVGLLPPERLAQPVRRAAVRFVPALDLLFDVQARLDVGQQLVGGQLSEPCDRVTEAGAEMGLGRFQEELAEGLFGDPFRLAVQHARHLELEKASVRTLRTVMVPVGIRTTVPVVSSVPMIMITPMSVGVVVTSALVHLPRT